jgi:hypothetical protein
LTSKSTREIPSEDDASAVNVTCPVRVDPEFGPVSDTGAERQWPPQQSPRV